MSDGELDELIEEVLVDAYNDSEGLTAFEVAFDEMTFPVQGVLLGRSVEIRSVVFAGDERRGLCALVSADGRMQHLDLLDVVFDDDVPEGTARLVAAYRRWWVPAG